MAASTVRDLPPPVPIRQTQSYPATIDALRAALADAEGHMADGLAALATATSLLGQLPAPAAATPADGEEYLTIKEVADILQLHPQTVYNDIKARGLPALDRDGVGLRVRRSDLDAWMGQPGGSGR